MPDALQSALGGALLKETVADVPDGPAVCRLYAPGIRGDCFVAWSRSGPVQLSTVMDGLFWVARCGSELVGAWDYAPVDADDVWLSADPTAIIPCSPPSPVIASICRRRVADAPVPVGRRPLDVDVGGRRLSLLRLGRWGWSWRRNDSGATAGSRASPGLFPISRRKRGAYSRRRRRRA